ncbi:DNA glycosylase AlkZ-like family protein [Tumebacillus permanentifrigoris]|uniref:Winged helix DNA-binding protein n=1 Tax=Tumebacillus permanentifrigoris TaxID=378543 RepID=A0A316D9L5_9BACL|nr:crosslink repair DNA glycosylase YcaQ family protein [Tumebacillus permanentifrigoris]PWK08428.1 hypothetical protein C7459_11581 [Tumebacillus permanentifrigoris]
MQITKQQVVRLNLWKQGLYHPPTSNTPAEALEILRNLGCVQLDTMSVVTRSQHLVFRSRMQEFREEWLLEWYERGEIFEHYLHALSILPMEEHKYFQAKLDAHRAALEQTDLHEVILQTLDEQGTVHGKHVTEQVGGSGRKLGTWEMSPVRRAFDQLWRAGQVGVTRNDKFHKLYRRLDLHVPPHLVGESVPLEETYRRYTQLALHAMGAATVKDIADYFRFKARTVEAHLSDVGARPVEVEGATYYVLEEDLELLQGSQLQEPPTHSTLLSPFDNLIWYRPRVKALFGLDFRLESYFPEEQRQFGYFALPILLCGEIVGTVDLKADRKQKTLQLQRLVWLGASHQAELDELLHRLHSYLFV